MSAKTCGTGRDRTSGTDAGVSAPERDGAPAPDLICLSHLRWDLVYQRPHHLMSRFARRQRVFVIEEPVFDGLGPRMEWARRAEGLTVAVPHLPAGLTPTQIDRAQRRLLDAFLRDHAIRDFVLWYYTPMALAFSDHLEPQAVVYDCMDELSLFKGAPAGLLEREARLFARADVVFTGGHSLFEHKRDKHPNVHAVPSSVDVTHFRRARRAGREPADQAALGRPRLGYYGVIDERMDLELVDGVAAARPAWQLVFLGPVVKIDPSELPRRPNIHYLGGRDYQRLPDYMSGWDAAILPFARNDATRFISPTKTPEYLAGGRPVVSTSIRDVVRPYGEKRLARIADTAPDFVAAAEAAMAEDGPSRAWLRRVDRLLATMSWDRTWARMADLVDGALQERAGAPRTSLLPGAFAQPPAGGGA